MRPVGRLVGGSGKKFKLTQAGPAARRCRVGLEPGRHCHGAASDGARRLPLIDSEEEEEEEEEAWPGTPAPAQGHGPGKSRSPSRSIIIRA